MSYHVYYFGLPLAALLFMLALQQFTAALSDVGGGTRMRVEEHKLISLLGRDTDTGILLYFYYM